MAILKPSPSSPSRFSIGTRKSSKKSSPVLVIYEGTREIHTIMQADYVLGRRQDKPLKNMLPKWPFEE